MKFILKPDAHGCYTMEQMIVTSILQKEHDVVIWNKYAAEISGNEIIESSSAACMIPDVFLRELKDAETNLFNPFNKLLYTDDPITKDNFQMVYNTLGPHIKRMLCALEKLDHGKVSYQSFR
jgi:hypothetical protein